MRVAEVMTRGVEPVAPDATVQDAATQMAEFDVGAVLVGDENGLVGILTDRDIILRVVVDGKHPAEVAVKDAMSDNVFTCGEDDTAEMVVVQMRERQVRRMPVIDDAGELVGIVTLSDLAKTITGPEQIQEAIRTLSEPHRSREAPQEESGDEADGAAREPDDTPSGESDKRD